MDKDPTSTQSTYTHAPHKLFGRGGFHRISNCIVKMMDVHSLHADDSLDEIHETLRVMRILEKGHYHCRDYLADQSPTQRETVDETWRQRMCEWMYGVVDHCNFRRDIVGVSATYLDMCLSRDREVIDSRRNFQLAAMTALYLAMKVHDTSFIKLESLIKLGRGLFTEDDVIKMESKILVKLEWQIHPPTTMCYVRQYVRLLPDSISPSTTYMVSEISRFVAEISVCLYKFVRYPPSLVAFATILISMNGIDEGSLPAWQRNQVFCRMKNVANVSLSTPGVHEVTKLLQASFEKNVDIKALMTTIDPNCHVGYTHKSRKPMMEYEGSPKDVMSAA